ncbi:MAG: 50S ribosomal protein L21 [Acidobacteriia bacterium]|nr:50S ribosomal protein L21 [Terriglobia bacterium]
MYAVIRSGGKQYRVAEGEVVRLEKLEVESGSVEFKDVLLVNTGEQTLIGQPLVAGATVTGTVEGEGLEDKVLVFKYKAKKQYRRTRGHRQPFAKVHIDKISVAAKTA